METLPNPMLWRASEQYMRHMSQSSRDAVAPAGRAKVGGRLMGSSGHVAHLGHGGILTSSEAFSSLQIMAKWTSLVVQCMAWRRKAVALAGYHLLAFDGVHQQMSLREERSVTYTFLRDPAWVAIFPELAVRCRRQMASRLGEGLCASADGSSLAAVRLAVNPRSACETRVPGSSAQHSRPPRCTFVPLLSAMPVSLPLPRALRPGEGSAARAGSSGYAAMGTPPLHPFAPPVRMMGSEVPEWKQRADDMQAPTMESLASCADVTGMTYLQTLDSLPDMAGPSGYGGPAGTMPMHSWLPHVQPMETETPERRRPEDFRTLTMDSIASCGDLAGMAGLQTLDSLPDMVDPEAACYMQTADSLPDILQAMRPPPVPAEWPLHLAPTLTGPACGGRPPVPPPLAPGGLGRYPPGAMAGRIQ